MFALAIDERWRDDSFHDIGAPADEFDSLRRKVDHRRRNRQSRVEPGFDGVSVRRGDIDRFARQQGPTVIIDHQHRETRRFGFFAHDELHDAAAARQSEQQRGDER